MSFAQLVGSHVRVVFRIDGHEAQVHGILGPGPSPGTWRVVDAGGQTWPIEATQIVSLVAASSARSPSPTDDEATLQRRALFDAQSALAEQAARERAALAEDARAATAAAEAAAIRASAERERLAELSVGAANAAREAAVSAENQREHLRIATVNAASAAEVREARAAVERQQLRTIVEQHSQQQQQLQRPIQDQHQQQQQQQRHEADRQASLFNEIVDQLRALSNRVDRLSPSGSVSPLPRRDVDLAAPPPFVSSMGHHTTSVPESTATTPDVVAFLARDESLRREKAPLWSSHEITALPGMDIFTAPQRQVLLTLPALHLLRAEPEFDDLKLAIRHLADATITLQGLRTIGELERHLLTLMRRGGREDAAVTPERWLSLRSAMKLLNTEGRGQALFELAIFALRVHPAFAKNGTRLDRLVVAALAVQPGSTKQVTRWTTKTLGTSLPAEAEIPLVGRAEQRGAQS